MNDRWHHLNQVDSWGCNIAPPAFDRKRFQWQVNRIAGVNRDGKPIIRLTWGQEAEHYAFGEWTPRYWTRRVKDGDGWRYYRVPRWILERRLEPEAYYEAHEANRYHAQPDGTVLDLGEPPEDYYVFDEGGLIAEHDQFHTADGSPRCCDAAWEGESKFHLVGYELVEEKVNARRRCWGYYREPNDGDLERLAKAVRERDRQPYYDPYAPLSREQLAVIEIEANMQAQRAQDEADQQLADLNRDFYAVWNRKIGETDYTAKKRGRYFFNNYNQVTGQTVDWNYRQSGQHGLFVPV